MISSNTGEPRIPPAKSLPLDLMISAVTLNQCLVTRITTIGARCPFTKPLRRGASASKQISGSKTMKSLERIFMLGTVSRLSNHHLLSRNCTSIRLSPSLSIKTPNPAPALWKSQEKHLAYSIGDPTPVLFFCWTSRPRQQRPGWRSRSTSSRSEKGIS